MNSTKPVIASIGTAVPPFAISQELSDRLMTEQFSNELSERSMEVLHQVLLHPSVRTRYVSVRTVDELPTLKNEDPDKRIERFTKWAVHLAGEALQKACVKAGLHVHDISALIVNTCTGYLCPGISTYLVETVGLKKSTLLYDLVGSGCGGAIPNIQLAQAMVKSDPAMVVACVAVEISSATFEMGNDLGLIVSNAIFGDGAAAAIVTAKSNGLALESTASAYFPESREYVRFVYKNGRLHNRLDAQLPKVMRRTVPPFIRDLLARQELAVGDIRHWAFHPGGDRILSAIQEELGLTDSDMCLSREILSCYGNMSSPTVLFVLEKLVEKGLPQNEWCCMAAYGAGMSIHGYLLRYY